MKMHEIAISPAIALQMLKQNKTNRTLKEVVVNEYARMMRAGLWKEGTGEAIKISTTNSLIDGQHRLSAIVKANITLKCLVINGVEDDIFTVIDSGAKRTPGDVLYIAGVKWSTLTGAAIRKYFVLKGNRTDVKARTLSNTEMLSLYEARPKFWDGTSTMAYDWYNKSQRILPTSEWAAFYALFADISDKDSFNLMDALANGLNLEAKSPINDLRKKLIFAAINSKFKYTPMHRTALIIKAWNYFRKHKPVSGIRFNPETEEYPKPI